MLEKKIPLSGINNDNDNDHIVKTTSYCIFNNYSSESIAHEAESWMRYWLRGHEGERDNCFSKTPLVGQKISRQNNFS